MVLEVKAGDVVVIPAGVSHKNLGASRDFGVVGAYPKGQNWDMHYGKPGERPAADERIAQVAMPTSDPVFGADGPMEAHWQKKVASQRQVFLCGSGILPRSKRGPRNHRAEATPTKWILVTH